MKSIITAAASVVIAAQTALSAAVMNVGAVDVINSKATNPTWQQLYSEQLNEYMNSTSYNKNSKFDLCDIDNDGTPELFISDSDTYHFACCTAYTATNGKVKELQTFRTFGTVSFIKDALLLEDSCNQGHSFQSLYKKVDDELELVFNAYTATNGEFTYKFLGQENADYILNEKESNKEEYENELSKFCDPLDERTAIGRKYTLDETTVNSVLFAGDTNSNVSVEWNEIYKNKLYELLDDDSIVKDSKYGVGATFDFYDIDNNGIPELFVSNGEGQGAPAYVFSVVNGKLVQGDFFVRYRMILVNSEYNAIYYTGIANNVPPRYYKYNNGVVTEVLESDPDYSVYSSIEMEDWDVTGYDYSFNSESIETALQEVQNQYSNSNASNWKTLYENQLYDLIDQGWTMEDNSSYNGSRFDFYDIDSNGVPELFVVHDNGQVSDGLVFSIVNDEIIQNGTSARYGSIMVNSEYGVITCNTGTALLPYIYFGKFENGKVTEILESDEEFSKYNSIENWDSVGYKYSFDSVSIETALQEAENEYTDSNAGENNYYEEFGVSDSDLEAAPIKPHLTVSKVVVPEDEASNIQRVEISVSGADGKFCNTTIQVYYDERLSISTKENGRYNISCSQSNLSVNDFRVDDDMSSIQLSTVGNGDFGNDGLMWTIEFVLPDDAKVGDVFPIDIEYTNNGDYLNSQFLDYNRTDDGNLMNAYVFTKGIYNKYNTYEGDEYLPAGSTYDGYIAVVGADSEQIIYGDANCDGKVEIADATLILQYLTNKDEYQLTAQGLKNADVCGNSDGVTALDALTIQQVDAGIYKVEDLPI